MSSFTTPLVIEDLENRKFKLRMPFAFWFDWDPNFFESPPPEPAWRYEIEVLPGLITDFASVPRLLWPILPPIGRYGKAAVLHDALYQFNVFPRKICDRIFLLAMRVLKVADWKRTILYYGTRLLGEKAYARYRERLKQRLMPLPDYHSDKMLVIVRRKS